MALIYRVLETKICHLLCCRWQSIQFPLFSDGKDSQSPDSLGGQ